MIKMNSSQSYLNLSQSESLQRKIRYKALLDKGKQIEHQINKCNVQHLVSNIGHLITESDTINAEADYRSHAENPTEAVLDVQVVKMNNELLLKVLEQNSAFDVLLYRNAILSVVSSRDEMNWDNLATMVCKITGCITVAPSLLGAQCCDYKGRVPKQRQSRKHTVFADEEQPQTVDLLNPENKGSQQLQIFYTKLVKLYKENGCKPLPFYKLIIDPNDFMNTVQNLYQISFLVRDTFVAIEKDNDNYPQVRPTTAAEKAENKEMDQEICSINMELCNRMIKFYDIKTAMLQ